MRLLKEKTNIDFMGRRKIALVFSSVMLLISLVALRMGTLAKGD